MLLWFLAAYAESPSFEAVDVTVSSQATCAVGADGGLYCWGEGVADEMPDVTDRATSTPRRIVGVENVVEAEIAGWNVALRHKDGSVSNLALGSSLEWRAFEGITDAVSLATSDSTACAMRADGTVWCWGRADWLPTREDANWTPVAVPGVKGATDLSCDGWGCCVADDAGKRSCWGDGSDDLGLARSEAPTAWKSSLGEGRLVRGFHRACVVDGGVRCTGEPLDLPLDSATNIVLDYDAACVWTDAAATCTHPRIEAPIALKGRVGAIDLATGQGCAVVDGAVVCWGNNDVGQLGEGRPILTEHPGPVLGVETATALAGAYRESCAVQNGGLWCWGSDQATAARTANAPDVLGTGQYYASCGSDGGSVSCYLPDPYEGRAWKRMRFSGAPTGVVALASDRAVNLFAATSRGSLHVLYSMGEGGMDERWRAIGLPKDFGKPVELTAPSLGVCARSDTGRLACWEDPRFEGDPDFVDPPKLAQKLRLVADLNDVVGLGSAGQDMVCARLKDGEVRCRGGLGFAREWHNGDAFNAVPAFRGATQLSSRHFHVCAVVDGGVRCFGDNRYGQLGSAPSDGQREPIDVPLPGPARAVEVGEDHSCALLEDGRVFCWGSDADGQLGRGRPLFSPVPVRVVGSGPTPSAPDPTKPPRSEPP